MSQIDIAPTLLVVLGFRYLQQVLSDAMCECSPQTDRAFVSNYQTLGYLKGTASWCCRPSARSCVRRRAGGRVRPRSDPALAREAIAFYQTASHVYRTGCIATRSSWRPRRGAAERR